MEGGRGQGEWLGQFLQQCRWGERSWWLGRAHSSGGRKRYLGMMDVDPWKPMIEERCHSSFKKPSGDQGLVKERTEVTGEVKADAAPSSGPLLFPLSTPQSHTQGVLSFCRLSPQAGISSCWPPGVCLVEAVYRLQMQFELKQFPQ